MKSDLKNYISTPVSYPEAESSLELKRDIDSVEQMLDNLIELIVFTPRGSFIADPEFGFEYWNHGMSSIDNYQEIIEIECQESIRNGLLSYAPQLKNISFESKDASSDGQQRRKVQSKHRVTFFIKGDIDNGIGTSPYEKKVEFFIEPTVIKKI